MGERLGADPVALERLAVALHDGAAALDAGGTALVTRLDALRWVGDDARRFREQAHRTARIRVRAATLLRSHAVELRRQAAEQRTASAVTASVLPSAHSSGAPEPVVPDAELRVRMATEAEAHRRRAEELRRRADTTGGPAEWLGDRLPVLDSRREDLLARANAESRAVDRLDRLLARAERRFLEVDAVGDGRLVEVLGDLERAELVVVLVPGMNTSIDDALDAPHPHAAALSGALDAVAPGRVAVVHALVYDPPDTEWNDLLTGRPLTDGRAAEGGRGVAELVGTLTALGVGTDRLTLVGHSYGSVATGAALRFEHVEVPRAVVVGSPGLGRGVHDRGDLHRPDVDLVAACVVVDPICIVPSHGTNPTAEGYGASVLDLPGASGHSGYFEGPGVAGLAEALWSGRADLPG